MTSNAVAIERCAYCGTDFPGSRLFCTSCDKPNRKQAGVSSYAPAAPHAYATAGPAPLPRGPVAAVQQPVPVSRSSPAPVPASMAVPTASSVKEPMSWEMLLIWSVVTLGLFAVFYAFKQAAWAKRLHPRSTATVRLTAWVLLQAASTILTIVATSVPGLEVLAIFGLLLILPSFAFGILYLLAMTETIAAVAAFNQVPAQPNKTLSILFGIIAVLFGIFGAWLGAVYFQHHIRTIEMHCSAAHP